MEKHADSGALAQRAHPPHSPPTDPQRRRFRIAGADVSASIAVFLIALPLSLGIALATDAPLQAGLVAAAVGGVVAGLIGGSPLQVSGPAAGLTVVTADLIHQYGWRTTCAITVLAGFTQLLLGRLRVARTALAVSPAIVHGMLAGIGVTIAVAQLHIVLGGTPQSSVLANLVGLPAQLARVHPAAVTMSALTLALLFLWPRIPGRAGQLLRTIPAPLIAVAGATATASLTALSLPKVELPSWSSHALAGMPEGPVTGIAAAVLTITLVCSVQSLLGAVAVDKLAAARGAAAARAETRGGGATSGAESCSEPGSEARTGPDAEGRPASDAASPPRSAALKPRPAAPSGGRAPRIARSDLDRELLGQGAANIVSGALGGLPVAGVAVRSSANVQAGAVSRNSTVLHGVLVVVAALLMVPILELIPLASLAALVMAVGIQMVSLHHIRTVTRHREAPVYAVTTAGVVFLGVLEGVALGVAVAVAVALNRLTRTRITHDEKEGVHHVHVRGQLTFLAVPRLSRALHLVPQGAQVVVELDGSFMDHAAYESLQDWQTSHTAHGGTVELTGRRAAVRIAEPAVLAESGEAEGSGEGEAPADPAACRCRPWTPWRNHQCDSPAEGAADGDPVSDAGHTPDTDADVGHAQDQLSARPSGQPPRTDGPAPGAAHGIAADVRDSRSGSAGQDGTNSPARQGDRNSRGRQDGPNAPAGHLDLDLDRHGRQDLRDPDDSLDDNARPGTHNPRQEHANPDTHGLSSQHTHATTPDPSDQHTHATTPDPSDQHGHATAHDPNDQHGHATAHDPNDQHGHATAHDPNDQHVHPTTNDVRKHHAHPDSHDPSQEHDRPDTHDPHSDHSPRAPHPPHPNNTHASHHPTHGHIPATTAPTPKPGQHQLVRGITAFQRNTAPLVRKELARLAREGQRPAQLFLTCADSRVVTSMITSSGPGDLFVVRNVGNLVPLPGAESGDDSVAAAIEYAVDVLKVRSITVCGHSGCGAMQALLNSEPGGAQTPLKRWLRHGLPSLERMADDARPWARLAGRAAADAVEQLCLTNVVQQLEHLRAHESVAQALRRGALELHGMYFHVGEAQAYLLTGAEGGELFDHVAGTEELRSPV
ncbi:SulP family inorganic anion transporter [Streptomyces sp. NPDC096205]|uniref:SulP family inorganic anion transporter n=1 Tax=Streptomyces sp. NPDC096205 TaxID=3366081 RepID=UPI00380531BC